MLIGHGQFKIKKKQKELKVAISFLIKNDEALKMVYPL